MRRGMRALGVGVAVAVIGMLATPVAAAPGRADARVAAGIGGGAQTSTMLFSGTIAPGVTGYYHWNNLPAGRVYQVGLSPQGASTTKPCQLEVTRQWYVQRTNGSRTVYWTVKNVGNLACGANMLLTWNNSVTSFNQSALNPGQSWNTLWNISNSGVWSVGLSPTGATSTKECSMELTRTWQEMDYNQLKLRMTIKNTGTVACSTTVLITNTPLDFSDSTDVISPGQTHDFQLNNVSPTVAYWTMLNPRVFTNCSLEITRDYWVQRVKSDGTTWREFHYSVKNVGFDDACDGGMKVDKVEA